jgi:putative membrane protein insertion efficiency factor
MVSFGQARRDFEAMRTLIHLLIRAYRWILSPVLHWVAGPGSGCRFIPSCSEYFEEAVEVHGACRGMALGLRRLCRCHPWTREVGDDPVPPASAFRGPSRGSF